MTAGSSFPRWLAPALLAAVLLCFATRNLPWHLDDFDQAKQAYVSWEMVQEGHWWFQHTPTGKIATKPPLAGWMSAALLKVSGGHQELAWRLPPLLASLALLILLWRAGAQAAGEAGALLAAGAFGLNTVSQRLATLVRTDMLLALTIFLVGWLIYEKLRRGEPWRPRDRWILFAVLLASFLLKGPIAYAFLLPGLALFLFLQRRSVSGRLAWSGWWPWLLPLAVFGLWAGLGIYLSRDFYEQVVLTEFLGRFQSGEGAPHRSQPVYFYLAHLPGPFFPWSLLLLSLAFWPEVRRQIRRDPALLWLVCWAGAGLLFMSLIPSKRPDRIFPVLPPLCLLLGASFPLWAALVPLPLRPRMVLLLLGLGLFSSASYLGVRVTKGYLNDAGALKRFGRETRKIVSPARLAVVSGKDEGMLLYLRLTHFTKLEDAQARWQSGDLQAIVLPPAEAIPQSRWPGAVTRLATGVIPEKNGAYILLVRDGMNR